VDKKIDVWMPHELTEENIMNRILVYGFLLKQNSLDPFLKGIMIADEKCLQQYQAAEIVVQSG